MNTRKRRLIGGGLAIVMTLAGAGLAIHRLYGFGSGPVAESQSPKLSAGARNGSELLVRSFMIRGNNHQAYAKSTYTGTLQPRYQAAVSFRIGGKIAQRLVELGNRVGRGQVLFRLDPEDADLQLRVAEADLVSAQSTLKQTQAEEARYRGLRSSGAVSQSDYDLAVLARDVSIARLDAAQRRLELAQNQRTYCDLVADSDGLITSISAEAGQVVSMGQTVLQLMQKDELEAVVSLPESVVAQAKNLKATTSFWSQQDALIPAELREVSPIADPVSRTFDARFRLLSPLPDLHIGMTATVHLTNEATEGLEIPLRSIANREDKPVVWKINTIDGRVSQVDIEVVQYRSETAMVRGDLKPGDLLVSAGVQRIDANSKVRLWDGGQR